MGITFDEILESVDKNLKFADLTTLPLSEKEDTIHEAVIEYSKKRPRRIVTPITGTTSPLYELPSLFEDGFSIINEIEFPVSQSPKQTIDEDDWGLDYIDVGLRLRFEFFNPTLDETFWLKYTIRHDIDSDGTTNIPRADLTTMGYLATALMCESLSTFFASKKNPNLSEAEIVEFATRVEEYSSRAEKWMGKFNDAVTDDVTGLHGNIDFSDDMFFDRDNE